MGKKIKKAFKKVVKASTGGLVGGDDKVKIEQPEPQAQQVAAPPPAQVVEPPKQEDITTDDASQTEAGRKKARAGGKKSLSVARSSGTGINV